MKTIHLKNMKTIHFIQKGIHIIYCKKLDISGYGLTKKEAKKHFKECLKHYF